MDDHARLYEYLQSHTARPSSSPSAKKAKQKNLVPAESGFEPLGEYTYRRVRREPNPLSSLGDEALLSAMAPAGNLIFFDTETTGLSGGAGNLAFLLGLGFIDGRELVTEQYFLSDFPGEEEFLRIIAPLFSPDRTFVSYNGSSFDSHLLVSRFRLNRLELSFPPQYDLLHPARRLWKTNVGAALGSCSLKNMEKAVLDVDRGRDIDGAEVPRYYFDFLHDGRFERLEPVFYHNHFDVLSLARLLNRIELLLRAPETVSAASQAFPADPAALGLMLHEKDPARAETFLENRWQAGDQACGRALGYYLKRARKYEQASLIWEALYQRPGNLTVGVELAMHLEHRTRNYQRALEVVRSLIDHTDNLSERDSRELARRRERLETKMKRQRVKAESSANHGDAG